MHVHASDRKLTEAGSAKFFVKSDGDTTIEKQGQLNEREVREIRKFIKKNYKEMYLKWQQLANTGYYGE
jgi:predicted glycosyltransferase involved in capsule biosynthesis